MADERLTIVAEIQPLIDRAASEAAMAPAALMTHLIVGRLGDEGGPEAAGPRGTDLAPAIIPSRPPRPGAGDGMPVRE